ncbi:Eco57I restriction-modification methylase domain-containing protein, partial [Candidatus Bipolaricaulota bacterium]|nr:Eco57I restriction-modification methylase domain-containing protein [Candidatus Bipolaricaulota bacterium]
LSPSPSGRGQGERNGFDAVIGNPPWISLKGRFANEICRPDELAYLTRTYVGDTYRPNIYEYFVKRAISLVKTGGFQAFIVPDRLGFNQQFSELRFDLAKNGRLVALLYKARFPGVVADTLVYVYMPGVASRSNVVQVGDFHGVRASIRQERFLEFQDYQFLPVTPVVQKLYFDLRTTIPLSQAISSSVGFIARAKTITEVPISCAQQPILRGRNVLRYAVEREAYFEFTKKDLVGGTQDPKKLSLHRKILMRKTGFPLFSTLDSTGRYPEQSLYFLYKPAKNLSLEYILGIVNSALFQHIYWVWMVTNRDATPQLKKIHLDHFPIRAIKVSDPVDKTRHDRMVELVETMLKLQKQVAAATTSYEKTAIQRLIKQTDKQIDQLVYELYGL